MAANISAAVSCCQQRRFWTGVTGAISVPDMEKPAETRKAKPTPADKRAAARLRSYWDEAVAKSKTDPSGTKLTQDVAAAELDVNQSAVSQYLNGLIPLNYRALLVFAKLIGVDPTLIRSDLPEQALDHRVREPHEEYGAWEDIEAYSQAVGLGSSAEAQDYAETHKLKFRAESLRRKGLRPQALCVFYGVGESMEPRIRSGDAVLFDTADTRPRDGYIFVVQLGSEINVKRCEILDDAVYFRSDNPAGDHSWRKPKRMDNAKCPITILGRVRWIGSWE